ncbi:EXS family protein [Whalleya microplaca]|nr:EXS family protein [Whalleya microplaca]
MDGDPAVEPELDSFSLTFPLPYRVAFIAVLAVWGWGVNLHYLHRVGIDVPSLIRYPGRPSPHHPTHHLSTYRLATVLSAIFVFSLLLFWIFTHRNPALVVAWDWLPLTYLIVLIALFVAPLKNLSHGGRSRFRATLRRISLGGLAEAKDGKFGDIILADVLTSYARVFGDLYVSLCMFFRAGGSATARPDRACGGAVVVPLVLAAPSLIRLRQCLIEFARVRRSPSPSSSSSSSSSLHRNSGWGGQHLANALKYFSAFPVVLTSALLRNWGGAEKSPAVFRAWVLACAVNSLYSFYWDVAKDWDLSLFAGARERNAPSHAWGLRPRLCVGSPRVYYGVIALDLVLRCTWSLKLSPHLDRVVDFESSIFVVEFLEVFRRWVWIFFRVETEWIRSQPAGPALDEILLGDYQGKYEDEEDD